LIQALYTTREKLHLDFGLIFRSGDDQNQFEVEFGGKYFFSEVVATEASVNPFFSGQFIFASRDPGSLFSLVGGLGAQVFLTKGLAFFGVLAVRFTNNSPGSGAKATTTFGTFAPAVGASFYF
jgi:hypothetical protein